MNCHYKEALLHRFAPPKAPIWDKIDPMSEKPLAERLQLKSGRSVYLHNPPLGFSSLINPLPAGATLITNLELPLDVIVAFIQNRVELEAELARLKTALKTGGILWVAYRKGGAKIKSDIHRDSINAYAISIGLQGVAIISIDTEWAALRLKVLA